MLGNAWGCLSIVKPLIAPRGGELPKANLMLGYRPGVSSACQIARAVFDPMYSTFSPLIQLPTLSLFRVLIPELSNF